MHRGNSGGGNQAAGARRLKSIYGCGMRPNKKGITKERYPRKRLNLCRRNQERLQRGNGETKGKFARTWFSHGGRQGIWIRLGEGTKTRRMKVNRHWWQEERFPSPADQKWGRAQTVTSLLWKDIARASSAGEGV